jgi:ubiquinone/menaquinone biosynthesis C-methylase UbiE
MSILSKECLSLYNHLYAVAESGLKIPFSPYILVLKEVEAKIKEKRSKAYILENLPDESLLPETEVLNWKPEERDSSRIVDSAIDYRAYISSNQYAEWFGSKFMARLTARTGRSFWRTETMRQLRAASPDLFAGKVLEVGAGTALISCELSHFEEVSEIYSLDYDEYTVENLMPLVQWSLGANTAKIKRVIGSYNEMEIDDDSFDIIVAVGSMHHSEDINATMKECIRVLKPGGKFIISDYALTSNLSQEEYATLMNLPKDEKDTALFEKTGNSDGMITNKTISEHGRPTYIYQAAAFEAGFTVKTTLFDATKNSGGRLSRIWRCAGEKYKNGPFYQLSTKSRTLGYDAFGNVKSFDMRSPLRYPSYAKRAPSLFSLIALGDKAGMPVYDNMVLILEKPIQSDMTVSFQYHKGGTYRLPVSLNR